MSVRGFVGGIGAGIVLLVVPIAQAASPHVESDSQVGTTTIHQEVTVWDPGTIHYWIHVSDPGGAPPFCVTLRLERKGKQGWRGIGMSSRKGDRGCCPQPEEECFPTATDGYWDLFVYPRGRIKRKVQDGRLRIHAFTGFGPSLVLRLDGPLS